MTPNEQIDRLQERHEALSESVEMLAALGRKYDRRIARASRRLAELAFETAEVNRRVASLTDLLSGLVLLAQRNEDRIDQPES